MTRAIRLGNTVVELWPDRTVTHLPDGATVPAEPQSDAAYAERARDLGYGDRIDLMSREHELAHAILAHILGLPESPTMRGVADKRFWPHWRAEEGAVIELQRYSRVVGVSLEDAAERLARTENMT